jgi:hypothetical protein
MGHGDLASYETSAFEEYAALFCEAFIPPTVGRRLTSLEQQREFSSYASKEKNRFLGTAEQADSVEHHALE